MCVYLHLSCKAATAENSNNYCVEKSNSMQYTSSNIDNTKTVTAKKLPNVVNQCHSRCK